METIKKNISYIAPPLLFFSFIYLFIYLKFNIEPINSLFFTLSSILSSFIIFYFPIAIFIPFFIRVENGVLQYKLKNVSEILSWALIFSLSFIYSIIIPNIIQFFFSYTFITVFIIFFIIPLIFTIFKFKTIEMIVQTVFNHFKEDTARKYDITIIFFITLIIRFPFFLDGEIGVDSFLFNVISNIFIFNEHLSYVDNFLSIIEFYPDSIITSPIYFSSSISILGNIPVYISFFMSDINIAFISTIGFYYLLRIDSVSILNSEFSRRIALISYIFLPLLMKFSDWTLTGRSFYLMISPFSLIIGFNIIFNNNLNFTKKISFLFITIFSLIISHGMGRILALFILVLYIYNHILNIKIKFIQKIFNSYFFSKIIVFLLGIVMFLLPYILFYFGSRTLVDNWVLSKISIIEFKTSIPALNYLIDFLLIVGARLGISLVLFIIGYAFIPLIKFEDNKRFTTLVLALITFFPLFSNSMYFYQSLTIILLLFLSFFYDKELITIKISSLSAIIKPIKKIREKKRIVIAFLLISNISIGMYIQYYRSEGSGYPMLSHELKIAEFFNNELDEDNLTSVAFCERKLGYHVASYVPNMVPFPLTVQILITAFPEIKENISISKREIDKIDLNSLITIARYGLYASNGKSLTNNIIKIMYEDDISIVEKNIDLFFEYQKTFRINYFVWDNSSSWPLVEYLYANNLIIPITNISGFQIFIFSSNST